MQVLSCKLSPNQCALVNSIQINCIVHLSKSECLVPERIYTIHVYPLKKAFFVSKKHLPTHLGIPVSNIFWVSRIPPPPLFQEIAITFWGWGEYRYILELHNAIHEHAPTNWQQM